MIYSAGKDIVLIGGVCFTFTKESCIHDKDSEANLLNITRKRQIVIQRGRLPLCLYN